MYPAKAPAPPVLSYQRLPGFFRWIEDSMTPDYKTERNSDPAIQRIDTFLSRLPDTTDDAQKKYMLIELFLATNSWLRIKPNLKDVGKPGRIRLGVAVKALRDIVQKALSEAFQCAFGRVPDVLDRHFSISRTAHGIYIDAKDPIRSANFEKYKVCFKSGKAMQFNLENSDARELREVDTNSKYLTAGTQSAANFEEDDTIGKQTDPNADPNKPEKKHDKFAMFVLTRDRELYVAPFISSSTAYPKYHSSIPRGDAVQCAGSMKIIKGEVKGICPDSGHYAPDPAYFLNVLEYLKTMGVNLGGISLLDHTGQKVLTSNAQQFLDAKGNWETLRRRAELNRQRDGEGGVAARGLRYLKRFADLQRRGLSKEKALETLFAEEFGRMNQSGEGGAQLWTRIWTGILSNMSKQAELMEHSEETWKTFLRDKIDDYSLHPPLPPVPSRKDRMPKAQVSGHH